MWEKIESWITLVVLAAWMFTTCVFIWEGAVEISEKMLDVSRWIAFGVMCWMLADVVVLGTIQEIKERKK